MRQEGHLTQLSTIQKLATGGRIAPPVVKKSQASHHQHAEGTVSVQDSLSLGTPRGAGGIPQAQPSVLRERLEKKKKEREKELDQAVEKKLQSLKEGPKSNAPSTLPTIFEDGLLGPVKSPSMGTSAPPLCGSGNPMSDTFGISYGSSAGNSDFSLPEDQGQIAEQVDQLRRQAEQTKQDIQEETRAAQESAQQSAQSALGSAQSSVSSDPEITLQPDSSSTNTYSAEELEQQVAETVKEAAVDGQPAAQMRLEEAEAALKAAQGEIADAGGAAAKANPTFSNDLGVLMEQFSRSDSQVEQSVIHGALDQLLDNAGDGLKEQVEKIRGQLQNMYDQADKAWKAREEAANTALLNAGTVKSEDSAQRSAGQRADDSTFLQQLVAQRLSNTQNVDSDTMMAALENKGLL